MAYTFLFPSIGKRGQELEAYHLFQSLAFSNLDDYTLQNDFPLENR